MEAIEAKTRSRPPGWVVPAIFAALVAGVLSGVWWQRGNLDSGDLVGIVSVVGSIAIALYTVGSNRETMRDQREHERAMQAQQFREGRAMHHREDAVRRYVHLRSTLGQSAAMGFDFSRLDHEFDLDLVQENTEAIVEAMTTTASMVP